MKRHINFWLVMVLAISLVLPIYSMAVDMSMTLRTEDGFSLTTNTPTIKSFAIDNDNNLVIILKEPPILDFGNPYPEITIDTPSSTCTIISNAYVKANPGTSFSFTVRTITPGATLSSSTSIVPNSYGASFVSSGSTGIFSWTTGGASSTGAPPGRYLAVFSATPSSCALPAPSTCTSQLLVVINLAQQYSLTLTAGANGSVSPAGVTYYDPGTQVQISATPSTGYYFSGWSDGGGTVNPRTVTMDQDRAISASFAQTPVTPTTYTLTTSVSPAGAGTVSGASSYTAGATATVTAQATTGYTFSSWSGDCSGTSATTTVLMNGAKSVTANFTYSGGGGGTGSGTKTDPIKLNKATTKILYGYIPSSAPDDSRGTVTLPAYTKFYFEVDPLAATGKAAIGFGIQAKFWNGTFSICKSVQDKRTGAYSTEVCGVPTTLTEFLMDNSPYEMDNYRFLYGIDNSRGPSTSIDIWATIQ